MACRRKTLQRHESQPERKPQHTSVAGTLVGPSFVREPPARVDFANETGALVECVAAGSPAPSVGWLTADGRPALPLSGVRLLLTNGSLLFPPFGAGSYRHDVHAATYRCVAANPAGKIVSRDVRVQAVVLQHFDVQLYYNKNVWLGNTAVLRCTIPSFVREFISVTSWLKDSAFNIYPSLKGDGKLHMLPTGELLVRHADDSDRYRWYQCRAVNRLTGLTTLSAGRAKFSVTDPGIVSAPRPLDKQVSLSVRKDQPIVLPCFAEAHPPPTQRWYRQERHALQEVTADERVFPVGDGLAIAHADESDAGQWVCVLSNSAGEQRVDVSLHVSAPLAVSVQPATKLTADVGSAASVRCLVSGAPPSAVTWLKDGLVLAAHGDTLSLAPVRREDAGMYQCLVRADGDSAQASVQLQLGAAKPQLVYKFINQTVQPGPAVSLKCIATGNPTPHITWRLDGFQLPQSDRFVIGQYVTLHGDVISHVNISNVAVEDGGIYSCTASNRVGEVTHSADMRVYGLPFVRPMPNVSAVAGEPLYIACPVSGYPIESITWEKDRRRLPVTRRQKVFSNGTLLLENVQKDTDRGLYRCTAMNKQGHSSSQTLPLTVTVPPKIAPFSFQTDLHIGERTGVQCVINKGDPPLTIKWMKDGGGLASDVGVRELGGHISALSIESLKPDHAGTYTCVASNAAATASHSAQLLVNVPPRIGPFSFGDLIEGERAQVQCVIQAGDPPLTLRWLKDGAILHSQDGINLTQDTHSSTLAIAAVHRSHAGNYTCVASNAAKSAQASAQLTVSVPPRWIQEPVDRNVTRDETVMFDCQAEGFPVPTVVWRKAIGRQPTEYQDLSARNHGVQIFSNGSLLIQHALPEHAGQYMCEATNGIGAGLSAVVVLTVHIPPQFEVRSAQASIRKGASQILQCEARGDTPMTIEWLREGIRLPAHLNPRYEVKESVVKGGFLSELHISSTDKGDSGIFICIAQNKYGRAERTVHLQVQDAPGKPQDVRVVDTTSRSVKIAWLAPSDDRSPVLKYIAQYKPNTSPGDNWHSVAAGSELTAEVSGLLPATLYQFRVVAENDLGLGEHSEPVLLQTDGEAPAGEPQGLSVTAVASDQLRVAWSPPLQHMWNGNILGYYIGYREHSSSRQTSYTYTTVSEKGSGPYSTVLSGLKKYRKYGVVVQAFNEKGPGPMSPEIIAQTLEDVPSAAPLDIKCAAKGPQVIFLTWQPPPLFSQNGLIQGYKVYYENMNEWPPGQIEAETVVTNELATELHGLQKFANYSLQIWAYTRAGDGVKSSSIYCRTEEDVPGSPANIKVLSSSPTSLVVSWMKPVHPNGHLVSYTLYSRILEGGREKDSSKRRLSPAHTHYELHDLRKEEEYEFWVTAFTKVGEGQSTRVVYATISSRVPAAIVSFGDTVSVRRRGSIQLPCVAVGIPSPERSWTAHENPVMGNAFSVQHDGTLHISDVQKHHEENYTCTVTNSEGEDHISYFLQVLVAPSAPLLQVSGTSTSWIQLKWNPVKNGGSAVRGYLLNFRKEGGGEWEERLLPRDATLYQLQGLTCGTEYHLQLFAFNSIGSGAPSELLVVRTNGSRPVKPNFSEFISVNITTVILNFKSWRDNGCPIISFGVEYRESSQQDWITAGNNLAVREHFPVMGLWPGTTYIFRITSTNSAGTTSGEYRIVTQSAVSGNLVPDQSNIHVNDAVPFYMDVAVILPVLISIITLIAVFVGVCIFFHRKPGAQAEGQSQPMVTLDNKHNIAQREQYYAAVQKGATSHSTERIPEFAEDISPYATFHVPNQPSSPAHIQTFVYHDHHLAAMETMKLKSSNPQDDYTKLRGSQKSKCARSESSDYSSSTAHRSDAGPVAIPIHTSTRNDIDGLSLQTILYQGGGIGPESSTSPEPSPLPDRRNVTRRQRHNVSLRSRRTRAKSVHRRSEGSRESHVDPPTSFSDGHELSEAECDMDTIRHYKWAYKGSSSRDNSQHGQSYNNFTIAV